MTLPAVNHMIGDVLDGLARIPTGSCAVSVSSPPYFARRAYTTDPREHGAGQTISEYVKGIVAVYAEVRRCLDDAGVAWLNIGDTATGSGGSGGDYNRGGGYEGRDRYRAPADAAEGWPGRTWYDVPGRLHQALVDDGWLVRARITWEGGRKQEDPAHARRPAESTEQVLMLTKPPRRKSDPLGYRWDVDALNALPADERGWTWHIAKANTPKGSGWKAPMPVNLALRCLTLTPPVTTPDATGRFVLDPYAGAGTTYEAAALLGVPSVGCDLDPDTVDQVRRRLNGLATVNIDRLDMGDPDGVA